MVGAMLKPSGNFLPVFLAILAAPGFCAAAVTLPAIEDNNTAKSTPTVTVANGTTISLKEAIGAQGNARTAFFKFNTATASAVNDGTLANFAFTLSSAAGTQFNMTLFALNAGGDTGNWTEETITWNNSPGFLDLGSANYLDANKVTSLGNFSITDGTAAGTTINRSFDNWQNYLTDGKLTLILVVRSQSTGSPTLVLHSAGSATPALAPSLNIIPEPGTLALAAISVLGLFRRRR